MALSRNQAAGAFVCLAANQEKHIPRRKS